MKVTALTRAVLIATALYDGVLGGVFLASPQQALGWIDVPPINHVGYLQFPAAMLLIFAFMFAHAVLSPARHRNLVGYGLLLKLAYIGVAGGHWIADGDLPFIWKPFVIVDAVFAVLLLVCWWRLRGNAKPA